MRALSPLPLAMFPLLAMAGCHAASTVAPPLLGLDVASVMLFRRTLVDIAYSVGSGQDCSLVRLDRGLTYCLAKEPPMVAGPVCTRSLGVPDCWANPEVLQGNAARLADSKAPTAPQEAWRERRWPGF